ncbi:Gfo/Idh/MocA family oxidoreductase [Candidatus Pelagibacter sp. HIMB1587]|uniref:Gfo/Idh/MocA family oxidoreductase n=1 Tax=Candidatus Pelagibacter sp. HIMB1587 TaxID=3413354 RepID=UPI003F83FBAB
MKKLNGVVIGPSGIGNIHIRELIRYGFNNIGIIGKKFKKNRLNLLKKNYKKIYFHNLKEIKEIKKIKPEVINICSPTECHYDHIIKTKKLSKYLIIEKPIFWIKSKNELNYKIVKSILNLKSIKIFVNLPMISLAHQLKKKEKFKDIKIFNFNYFTKGKNKFNNIPIDLLPHALSFLLSLNYKQKNSLKIIKVNKKKYSWNCKAIINNCLCQFSFKQNSKAKESNLSFQINDDIYLRKSYLKNNIYVNKILKNQKTLINVKNPMSEYLSLIFKNLNKNKMLKKNNDITIKSTEIMVKLLNN